jgi:hypothetical protein
MAKVAHFTEMAWHGFVPFGEKVLVKWAFFGFCENWHGSCIRGSVIAEVPRSDFERKKKNEQDSWY